MHYVRKIFTIIATIVGAVLLSSLAVFTLAADSWAGAASDNTAAAYLLGISFVIISIPAGLADRPRYYLLLVPYCLLLVVLRLVDLSPVKPALRAAQKIHAGM